LPSLCGMLISLMAFQALFQGIEFLFDFFQIFLIVNAFQFFIMLSEFVFDFRKNVFFKVAFLFH